jgi:hypothetical protein
MTLQHCQQTGSYTTTYTTVNYNALIQDNFILLEKRGIKMQPTPENKNNYVMTVEG